MQCVLDAGCRAEWLVAWAFGPDAQLHLLADPPEGSSILVAMCWLRFEGEPWTFSVPPPGLDVCRVCARYGVVSVPAPVFGSSWWIALWSRRPRS